MKTCTSCLLLKPLKEYHRDSSKKDGRHSQCKNCHSVRNKIRRKNNPEYVEKCRQRSKEYRLNSPEVYKASVRNSTLKKKYGIGITEYNLILKQQGGSCAICNSRDTKVSWSNNLHVDHDHNTGKIRGLLCQPCNVSLGKMNDSPSLLRKAADYIEKNKGE